MRALPSIRIETPGKGTTVPEKDTSVSCEGCAAQCCRYVSLQIDTPASPGDFDHIRWYLLHREVSVYVDHEGDWCLEFKAVCRNLDRKHRCKDYARRPAICRAHGNDWSCERTAEDPSDLYRHHFTCVEELDAYLAARRRGSKRPRKRAG